MLKEISSTLREQNRILKQHSPPSMESPKDLPPVKVPDLVSDTQPRLMGWSVAQSHQREGTLLVGDVKVEEDDSQWVWAGEIWEPFKGRINVRAPY